MANTPQNFTQIFLTYRDVRESNPGWTDKMIEDYLSLKRDLLLTAETADSNSEIDLTADSDPLTLGLIADIRMQIGSGDFLTSDETGFTVDTDLLSVDMDEA